MRIICSQFTKFTSTLGLPSRDAKLNPRVVAPGPRDPGYYVFTLYTCVPSACAYKVDTVARGSLGYYAGRFFIPVFQENVLSEIKIAEQRKTSGYSIYFLLYRYYPF